MGMNKDGKHKTYVLKYFNDHHITFYICIEFLFLVVKTTHEKNHRRIFGGQPPAVLFFFKRVFVPRCERKFDCFMLSFLNVMQKSQTQSSD